jgi:hypothetical protein
LRIGGQLNLKKEAFSMTGVSAKKKLLFSGLKKLLSQYEIASFRSLFPGVTFGKKSAV